MQGSRPVAVRRQAFFGPNSTTRSCGRKRVSDATHTICSHFAPITSRNRTKQEQARCIIRKRGTTDCRTLFPKDQRVTGHGRVVLITQRSLVQIQPPQPCEDKGLADAAAANPFRLPRLHPGIGRAHGAEHHSFTGVRMGAPLAFSSITTNLAGSVSLALRPTT